MSKYSDIIRHLDSLATEQVNPFTADLDQLDSVEIVRKINHEDKSVAFAVERELATIAAVAEIYAATLRQGGRVFYIGAGTSGRLGVLDAAECPPTFGTDPDQIVGLIAGGYKTLLLSAEGAEDNRDEAIAMLKEHQLSGGDLVIGLAASVRTPYTMAALEYASETGARTAIITCNKAANLQVKVDHVIAIDVGPEAITGSTRMKSGTAQKMTLNLISTTAMVLLGKTYGNLMIDLQARSDKLAARSRKILIDLLGIEEPDADELLAAANGSVKTAIVMHKLGCDRETAIERLARSGGVVRRCVENS